MEILELPAYLLFIRIKFHKLHTMRYSFRFTTKSKHILETLCETYIHRLVLQEYALRFLARIHVRGKFCRYFSDGVELSGTALCAL